MQDFRQLKVWGRAHELVLKVYDSTNTFPSEERYGLTSQLRRASSSIPTNIAEGCGRSSDADFARFLSIAIGSASEVEYLLILSHDLNFVPQTSYEALTAHVTEVRRMLISLRRRLKETKS